ncbi:Predicted arabinose efflux permease, MFS family [Microlunatus sagamiharensis]|uniref:Predicted arabinose efflux permease, MFS family n=1 Tax=Microlunatus sagamiharensis TaxID=546874 RepID=A0A1H2NDU1_9ACTN|nr:MFS transporter [Microlunatus sagamiharensis]SDV03633.1 Predicted arabinose efflux permease, MFS family [Microlunatus sagamiharensis]
MTTSVEERPVKSLVPVRMDKMPWSRFHWMVIFGLGTAWILDGLEIQIVAAAGYAKDLDMNSTEVGATATVYLIGQVVGALFFGRLTDKLGRKKLFIITLAVYLLGSGIAGFAPNMWFLWIFRFVAGAGIGGEYSAINSAIDELMPGKYRGRVDLAINGTYWAGAVLGSLGSSFLLDTDRFAENIGWRIAFFIGPVLGLIIIFLRRHIPESPRWLVTHGQGEEAERIVSGIEQSVRENGKEPPHLDESQAWWIKAHEGVTFRQLRYVFLELYPTRTVLGLTLMITQSFLYNAIFFTSSLVLQNFYGKTPASAALYFFPFAIGNLLGPLILGRFFDTVGRRKMIGGSYSIAAAVLFVSSLLFQADLLSAGTHTALWCLSFFFASAGASAGYLTVSEIFPLEVRGQAISYFFSIAQIFGAVGPLIFGALIGEGTDRGPLFWGYVGASIIMLIGGLVAFKFGVDAEGKALEDIAPPLSTYDENGNQLTKLPV